MTFTYNDGVPAANNNPSNDQPIMLQNAQAIGGILSVDHIGFNQNFGGKHLQVNFPSQTYPTISAPSGNASIAFPKAGTASTTAQLMFQNSLITTQLSAIRAWAFCSGAGAIIASQSVNVATVARTAGFPEGGYTITLTPGAVTGTNFAILVTASLGPGPAFLNTYSSYNITGANTFTIEVVRSPATAIDPTSFSFQVLQI